jgi:hypothetical protein
LPSAGPLTTNEVKVTGTLKVLLMAAREAGGDRLSPVNEFMEL